MRRDYIIWHWLLILLLGPLVSQLISVPDNHVAVGLLEVYPIAVMFSIFFSLPTYFVYLAVYYFLLKTNLNTIISKVILISVTVLGVYITESKIDGIMSQEVIIAYSVTAIFVGLVLPLRKSQTEKPSENSITT